MKERLYQVSIFSYLRRQYTVWKVVVMGFFLLKFREVFVKKMI